MIVKSIEVRPRPGHHDAYLASQRVWDRESRTAPGFVGTFCGRDPRDRDVVQVLVYWRSRADYETWMATEHDRIASLAGAEEHIGSMTIRVLDDVAEVPGLPPGLPPGLLPEETLEAADVQLWSELYRVTVALRVAVQLALFDALGDEPAQASELAARLGADGPALERVLTVLQAMGLVQRDAGGWVLAPLAARTLRTGAPSYQGHMVLHNSRPDVVRRWWRVGEELGVAEVDPAADPGAAHELFVAAMSDTAGAGQAAELTRAVDWQGVRRLLDVGGGAGDYSVALCRSVPAMTATVLDLPATEPLARAVIDGSGLPGRITFLGGDYREGSLPGPVDAVLLSNILRGETEAGIEDLLTRARAALTPGGVVVVHDLLPEDPPASPGLRAALFGLHLTHAANPTPATMAARLERAGLVVEDVRRLRRSVVANHVIVARRPG